MSEMKSILAIVLRINSLTPGNINHFVFTFTINCDDHVAQERISMCANSAQEWAAAETCVEHLSLRCGEAEVLSQGYAK